MKKQNTLLMVVAIAVGLPGTIAAARFLAYNDNKAKCDAPVDASELDKLGVALPPGAKACRALGGEAGAERREFQVLLERPSVLCFASVGLTGCTSTAKAGVSLVGSMSGAGWDTGKLTSDEKGGSFDFERGAQWASFHVFRSDYGELTATLTVRGGPPSSKGKDSD